MILLDLVLGRAAGEADLVGGGEGADSSTDMSDPVFLGGVLGVARRDVALGDHEAADASIFEVVREANDGRFGDANVGE